MEGPSQSQRIAADEKWKVAFSSVIAAVLLVTGKLAVGMLTDSLGIMSEALHSGLDLVAAAVTLIAVRVSARPADQEHSYGHGKMENLSALFETFLLLLTCVWIIYEALHRLFVEDVKVEANIWGFAVMAASIVVDVSRSRALMRVAEKYGSQALEADALHFRTDIWSSLVVLVGLGAVYLSSVLNVPWLQKADPVAALGVAVIVIWVSYRLGRKTIDDLLDAVPPNIREEVGRVSMVPGVLHVSRVRVRRSGPETFADVTLLIKREVPFESTHDIASQAESAIRRILPDADVVVHVEPFGAEDESAMATMRVLAARHGMGAHGISISEQAGARSVEMHLEVSDKLRVDEAHQKSNQFERDVRQALPDVERITTHLEPISESDVTHAAEAADDLEVLEVIKTVARENSLPCRPHSLKVQRVNAELSLSLHCDMEPSTGIRDAHALTIRLEQLLRARLPHLGRVVIHVEPGQKT